MSLDKLRQELDKTDAELLKRFQQRMALVEQIAQLKKEQALPILDTKREQEKLTALAAQVTCENQAAALELFRLLFKLSRDRQTCIINK